MCSRQIIRPHGAVSPRLGNEYPDEKQGEHRRQRRLQQAELSNSKSFPLKSLAHPMSQYKSHPGRNQKLREFSQ